MNIITFLLRTGCIIALAIQMTAYSGGQGYEGKLTTIQWQNGTSCKLVVSLRSNNKEYENSKRFGPRLTLNPKANDETKTIIGYGPYTAFISRDSFTSLFEIPEITGTTTIAIYTNGSSGEYEISYGRPGGTIEEMKVARPIKR